MFLHFTEKYHNIISFAVVFIFAMTLLRSSFYGISSPDESFYLTIPYRIIKGDALLVDEWHASQLSAFLLYLPMKIYLLINKSTEGMILYFRCLFVFCQTAVSLFTYHKLKKYGTFAALVSAVIYLLYVPEAVNMLDYYTMSLMGFHVTTLILFCSEKLNAVKLIFAGIVFACVVVAQPFNCLIYFIYSFAVLILLFYSKRKEPSESIKKFLSVKTWVYLTLGIIIVAVIFLAFLFSQITFTELINNIGNLFGGDNHTLPFSNTGKTDMFSYLTIFITFLELEPIGFFVALILIFSLIWDKKRLERRNLWILASFSVMLFLSFQNCLSSFQNIIAGLFKPYILFVLTFVCLMLTRKKDRNLFYIWCSGIVYIIFLGIISQALDYVGIIGFVISNTALMPSLMQLYDDIRPKKNTDSSPKNTNSPIMKVLCCLSILIILFDVISGTTIKFNDDTMAKVAGREILSVDTVIGKGPLKGIRTNNEIAETYSNIIDDLEKIKDNSCEQVLVAGLIPWIYFYFDEPPATFTTWYIEEEFELYEEYYKNKDKIPQCIYVPKTKLYFGFDYTEASESYRDFFSRMFAVSQTNGKAGYILYVNEIK